MAGRPTSTRLSNSMYRRGNMMSKLGSRCRITTLSSLEFSSIPMV